MIRRIVHRQISSTRWKSFTEIIEWATENKLTYKMSKNGTTLTVREANGDRYSYEHYKPKRAKK